MERTRRAQVVMACATDEGGQDFLAVTTLGPQASDDEADIAVTPRLNTGQLPLPYAPPELI